MQWLWQWKWQWTPTPAWCALLLAAAPLAASAAPAHASPAAPSAAGPVAVQAPAPLQAPGAPAEPASDAPLSKGEAKALRDFRRLDFNRDGRISRAEVALFPRLAAAFDEADTNHDHHLSYDEVRAFAVRYRAERERSRAAQAAADARPTSP